MFRIWAVILLLSILMQSFSRQVIFTEFLIKRDFIAKVLCEQKAQQDNHCQGKCQLKKQLKKDTERQEKSNQQLKTSFEVLFSQNGDSPAIQYYPQESLLFNINFSEITPRGYLTGIFHPPSC